MLLSARGIGKAYGDCVALADAGIELAAGEVHALIGENGAGKSTLLRMLYRLETPDRGQVLFDEKPLGPTVRDAQRAGIRMVQQHFALVPDMTALENILIGQPELPTRLDLVGARARLAAIARDQGLRVDPDRKVTELSIGERQRVEILRALWEPGRVLLLDEPTAVLAPQEIDELFTVIAALRAQGLAICIVTHKLGEMQSIADRITVLHRGKNAGAFVRGTDSRTLAAAIVGKDPPPPLERGTVTRGEPRLEIERATLTGPRGTNAPAAIEDLDLVVHSGEIVGVAGVEGNGQTELGLWLAGLWKRERGTLRLDRRAQPRDDVPTRHAAGLAYIAEDRHRFALLPESTVADNVYLFEHTREGAARTAAAILDGFAVSPRSTIAIAGRLSGGNQQKLVIGRTLAPRPNILIAAQPTRGVDLGAMRVIHEALLARRNEGAAILLLSADLDELLTLSTRIVVLYRGKIVAEIDNTADALRDDLRQRIGAAMVGAVSGAQP